jgi:chromosome segregation ATPase
MKRQFASKSNLADEEKILAEVKAKAERQVALQTRSAELETQFKDLSAEKAAKRTRTAALQSDVQITGSAFSEAKDGLERLEKEWQTRQQESKADLDDLARVTAEVESVEAKAAGADLGAIEKALGRATESIAVLEENVRRCTADAAQLTQDLGHEDLHRKLIQDNLDLRRTEREVEALRAAVKGIQDRRGPDARAAEEATREMARANQERTRHTTEEVGRLGVHV